ncbi:MAG: hypothetical protein ACHQFW_02430 [Chitinophagales bacterium]
MKRVLLAYSVAVVALLILSYVALQLAIRFFPGVSEQYFDPLYSSSEKRTWMYFIHPFIIAIAIKYFWQRFKQMFKGGTLVRGLEIGLIYSLIAIFPAMWITFSGVSISISVITTWLIYGTIQACITGIIYAKLNP